MGGSSSQPRTDPPRSPINAFSIEELYTPEFSESLQENTGYWQAPNTYEAAGEQVATSPTKNNKKATRKRQKRMIENDDAPRQTLWTTEEEITLAKGWLAVYENSKDGNAKKKQGFWCEVLEYIESKTKQYGRRTYDAESESGDEDYVQRAMIHYEIKTGIPFKLHHCWEILKDRPKWQKMALPKFSTGSGGSKRHKSSGSSSFNTQSWEASINLNTNVDDNDEDEVQEVQRPEGRDKARAAGKKKKVKSVRIGNCK
ncbi:ribonuclease H-like domain-containing protein [Tanacetum coccineum]